MAATPRAGVPTTGPNPPGTLVSVTNPLLAVDQQAVSRPLPVRNGPMVSPSNTTARSPSIVATTTSTPAIPPTPQANTGDAVIDVSRAAPAQGQPSFLTDDPQETREVELDESLFSVFPYDWCGWWEWPMLLSGYLVQFLEVAMLIAKSEKTQCDPGTGGDDWDTVVARIVMWFILVLTVFQDFQNGRRPPRLNTCSTG
jgi:hypothetical protein